MLDLVNTKRRDKYYSRDELVKFLRTQLRPGGRVAIYALSADLHLRHDFTSDVVPLITALHRYKAPATPLRERAALHRLRGPNQ